MANNKLVDKERLAKLAKALDDRAKLAVNTEKERALAVEQAINAKAVANAADIAAINDADAGILAQAKAHAQGLVDGEKLRAEGEEAELLQAINDEIARATGEEGKLAQDIKGIEEELKALIGDVEGGEGEENQTVAQQLLAIRAAMKDADDALQANITAEETARKNADQALQDQIDDINGEGEGSIKAAVAAEAGLREAADNALGGRLDTVEAFVAGHSDTERDAKIAALEAKFEGDNSVDARITAAQAAADQAQEEVDDVEGRALALEGRMNTAEANIAKLDGAVDVEGSVKKQIKDAIDAVNTAAGNLEDRVEANENKLAGLEKATVKAEIEAAKEAAAQNAKDYADDQITALVDSAPEAMNTLKELAEAIKAHQDVYDGYVAEVSGAMASLKTELQAEIDADVKAVVDVQKTVNDTQAEINADFEGRIDDNEAFVKGHSHDALQQGIEANTAAIEKEVEDRNDAIADALESYSTTKEVKAILANVVATLNLSMEDDQVVLKLGGADGIEVTSVALDLATDDDIDAIIAGLDAE